MKLSMMRVKGAVSIHSTSHSLTNSGLRFLYIALTSRSSVYVVFNPFRFAVINVNSVVAQIMSNLLIMNASRRWVNDRSWLHLL